MTGRLLAFSAQHEQRRLMMSSRQLDILDDFGGKAIALLLEEYRLGYDRRAEIAARLEELDRDSGAREREAELLRFQLAEIEAAGLTPGEDEELEAERRRLLAAGELKRASAELAALLSGESGGEAGATGGGVLDALAQSLTRLEDAATSDPALEALAGRLRKTYYELEETGADARGYGESVTVDPQRLAEIEERLDLIGQLKRKYGGSIEAALTYERESAGKLQTLTVDIEGRPVLEKELRELENDLLTLAQKITALRRKSAALLEREAGGHLSELAFQDCGFEIMLTANRAGSGSAAVDDNAISGNESEHEDGGGGSEILPSMLTRNGAESAEFLVRLNPGMPATPLKDTASGGELSRIMLAIKSAVSSSRDTATLVFDEIDAGIGGETGGAVGAKLKTLAAAGSQIICITHLPQIAAYADTHFSVVKRSSSEGGREATVTEVSQVSEEGLVDELCRMMGSRPEDSEARAHARGLLERAACGQVKTPAVKPRKARAAREKEITSKTSTTSGRDQRRARA